MKIKITLRPKRETGIVLPMHYNYMLQSFIYRNLDKVYSYFLHNSGFNYKKRLYKLVTFSSIFGRRKVIIPAKKIIFIGKIHFYISSILDGIMTSHVKALLKKKNLRLGGNEIDFESAEPIKEKIDGNTIRVKTLSPITIHSTNKDKKTIYFNPYQEKFYQLLIENLKKKCSIVGLKVDASDISIEPAEGAYFKKVITFYKRNFVIEAWKGEFILKGPKLVLEVALSSGLGDRNSQGFGMVSVNNK